MKDIKITNTNGVLTVSSLQVAENFEKEHRNVIQAIENLTAENSAVTPMFIYQRAWQRIQMLRNHS